MSDESDESIKDEFSAPIPAHLLVGAAPQREDDEIPIFELPPGTTLHMRLLSIGQDQFSVWGVLLPSGRVEVTRIHGRKATNEEIRDLTARLRTEIGAVVP